MSLAGYRDQVGPITGVLNHNDPLRTIETTVEPDGTRVSIIRRPGWPDTRVEIPPEWDSPEWSNAYEKAGLPGDGWITYLDAEALDEV